MKRSLYKKILILLCLVFFTYGCAALSQAERDMLACKKDPVCYQMAKDRSELVRDVVGTFNPIAGSAAGALILTLGLWIGGRKKQKGVPNV